MNWKTLLCAALFASTAAQADAPSDYRSGALLRTEGEATWYRLNVPMSVYWAAAHADLRDLRVFNAAGEALPYALTSTEERRTATYREASARFFPLYGSNSDTAAQEGLSVRIRRDANGVLVEVRSDDGTPAAESDAPLRGWLLDVSALDFPLERLRLDWKNGAEGFQRFRIEASDDLEHWQHWGEGQIARLNFDGERIERNEIRLPKSKTRYLRLTWLTPEVAATLNAATLFGVQSGYQPAPLLWSEPIEGSKGNNAGEFIWKLPLTLPLERLHVAVSEPNTLAPVIVSGAWRTAKPEAEAHLGIKKRPRPAQDIWQTLARGLLYRLPVQGGEDVQEEIDLSGAAVNQLRLQVDSRGGGLWQKAGQPPQLRVAIYGHQLIFLARGEPPYRLAFGRPDAQSAALPLNTLVPAYDSRQPEKVKFGNADLADATAPVTPAKNALATPEEPAPQGKAYALWATLLAGVALLLGMAVSLLRGEKKVDAG
ncbi:hypothetical protein AGMMS49545_20060 [Betaproteobacteria bacterium]|nr:hypothetical protein AGMMS49545_20060 [Betaproteobacteria bacterium]GHU47773.1 hypothetical protein AGMMS50289_23460 [Betaproteobacteria bacterium]